MTREDAKKIVMTISVAYPNWHPLDLTATVNVYYSVLGEYEYQRVAVALKKYILSDTTGFAPAIGQIVGMMAVENHMPELEAWAMCKKAISNSIYHSKEEYAKLPDTIKRTIGDHSNLKEWAVMDIETVNSVVQSHFIKNYRAECKKKTEEDKLPPKFVEQMKNMKMLEKGSERHEKK